MRPQKTRWIKCLPGERCFRPRCRSAAQLEGVVLSIDEFEAVRLNDWEDLTHAQAASRMKISRPTFTRILGVAHKKIADGLVNVKAIRIEGGCCQVKGAKR